MTCTTCGRENPPHLTFCQECGQRLGPRIAPPTPPIGLGGDYGPPDATPPPARQPSHAGASGGDPFAQPPSRLATSLGAGPSPVAAAAQAHVAQVQQAQPAAGAERRCRICATPNGPNLRYCTSCGSTLEAGPTAAQAQSPRLVEAAPAAPAPAQAAPVAPAPAPFAATALADNFASVSGAPHAGGAQAAAIAPMRVVDLGSPGRPAEGPRMCNRCRGVVDAAAQFCKFCGASLVDAPQASHASHAHGTSAAEVVAPLAAHERLELPRTNGQAPGPRPGHQHPPTEPMQVAAARVDPPTPFASFPIIASAAVAATSPAPVASAAAFPAASPTPAALGALLTPQAISPGPPPAAQAQARASAFPASPAPPAERAPAQAVPTASRAVTRGRLVVIAKSGADGPSYPIGDTLDVGRSEGQIVVGEDPYLSPRHVRIAWTGSKLVLRDLASTNGVYIRLVAARDMSAANAGSKAAPADDKVPGEVAVPLHDQDLILVGQQVLRFESAITGSHGEAGFGPATEHGTLLFGSPAAPRYARLSQRTVEGVTRDVYYVRKVETVLGRESGDVVFTEDPFLSRRHAAIRVLGRDGSPLPSTTKPSDFTRDGIQFALVDLGSSNGSFLRIRNEIDLVPGDHFRVGQQLFRVDFGANDSTETRESRGRAG